MGSAVVLGGGGITGIAWEVGVVQALRDAGVDLGAADLILGTSAGSVVGTLLAAGVDLDAVASEHLTSEDLAELGAEFDFERLAVAVVEMTAGAESFQQVRARIGALALSVHGNEAERLAVFESRLPVHEWPEHDLRITGVDTSTGEPAVWSRTSGVPLLRAVAASCAVPGVWPPVTIDGRRYMDGGVRSTNNADLVAGSDPVVVLAPYTIGLEGSLDAEIDRLAPARVAVVTPHRVALDAIGPNPLDPARRAEALRAGLDQGREELERVRAVWTGQAT